MNLKFNCKFGIGRGFEEIMKRKKSGGESESLLLQMTLEISDANRNEIDDLLQRSLGIIQRRDRTERTHIQKPVVQIGDNALLDRLELETDSLGIGNDRFSLRPRLRDLSRGLGVNRSTELLHVLVEAHEQRHDARCEFP